MANNNTFCSLTFDTWIAFLKLCKSVQAILLDRSLVVCPWINWFAPFPTRRLLEANSALFGDYLCKLIQKMICLSCKQFFTVKSCNMLMFTLETAYFVSLYELLALLGVKSSIKWPKKHFCTHPIWSIFFLINLMNLL